MSRKKHCWGMTVRSWGPGFQEENGERTKFRQLGSRAVSESAPSPSWVLRISVPWGLLAVPNLQGTGSERCAEIQQAGRADLDSRPGPSPASSAPNTPACPTAEGTWPLAPASSRESSGRRTSGARGIAGRGLGLLPGESQPPQRGGCRLSSGSVQSTPSPRSAEEGVPLREGPAAPASRDQQGARDPLPKPGKADERAVPGEVSSALLSKVLRLLASWLLH